MRPSITREQITSLVEGDVIEVFSFEGWQRASFLRYAKISGDTRAEYRFESTGQTSSLNIRLNYKPECWLEVGCWALRFPDGFGPMTQQFDFSV